jgi:hypothetical protein
MARAGASRDLIEKAGGWTPGSRMVAGYIDEAAEWTIGMLDGVL